MMPALQSALAAQNTSVEQVFPGFTEANYTLAYQNQVDFRSVLPQLNGEEFRPVPEQRTLNAQTLSVSGPIRTDGGNVIQHLGTTYVEFTNRFNNSTGRSLSITVDLYADDSAAPPVVKMWAITQYSPTVISTTVVPNFQRLLLNGTTRHYRAQARVPRFDSYRWVAMDIIHPQTNGSATLSYNYRADVVSPAVIYAGGTKGYASTNDGVSWTSYTFPNSPAVQAVAAVPQTQGQTGYMATSDLKLWKTTDAGATFTMLYDFAPKVQGVITNTHFSLLNIDPVTPTTLYVGLRGKTDPFWGPDKGALFKSTDGGVTFGSDLLQDCHDRHDPGDWQDCAITSLAIDPTNTNVLWIGQDSWNAPGQTLMRSTDGGATWQPMLTGQIATFTRVSISKVNSNVVWALLQQQLSGQYVFHTAFAGASWDNTKLDNTLNPADKTILADPFDISSAWASGGGEGLKRSKDGNQSWQAIGPEFHGLAALDQVLYGAAQWPVGTASIQQSVDGGLTWINIGDATMNGLGDDNNAMPLSIVSP